MKTTKTQRSSAVRRGSSQPKRATISTAKAKMESAETIATRVHSLSSRLPKRESKDSRLSPAIRKELKLLCLDAEAYLTKRIHSVERLRNGFERGTVEMEKTEAEIAALNDKGQKTQADYERLNLLERMSSDFNAKNDSTNEAYCTADQLLNAEIDNFQQQLTCALSVDYLAAVLAKAVAAVAPFCDDIPPLQFARNLPAIASAQSTFRRGFNPAHSGVENARKMIALIKKTSP